MLLFSEVKPLRKYWIRPCVSKNN